MIIALAIWSTQVAKRPTFVELPDPSRDAVSMEILIPCLDGFGEPIGAKDRDDMEVMLNAMAERSLDFSRAQVLTITNGRPIRVEMTAIGARISVAADDLTDAMKVVTSMIVHPPFEPDDLAATADRLMRRPREGWSRANDPLTHGYRALKSHQARLLYERVFHPERMVFAIGGKFTTSDALRLWDAKADGWSGSRPIEGYFDITPIASEPTPGLYTRDLAQVRSSNLAHPESSAARILAAFAIGAGKDSTIFRVIREKLSLAYRAELAFVAQPNGVTPRLVFASTQTVEMSAVIAALREDVQSWNATTRDRAIAMVESAWRFDGPEDILTLTGTIDRGYASKLFRAAAWVKLTGLKFDSEAWLAAMNAVDADAMKAAALEMLND